MLYLSVILVLVLLALSGWVFWLSRQIARLQDRYQRLERDSRALRGALSAVCTWESSSKEQQKNLDQRMTQLAEQQQRLLLRDVDGGPYQHALRLAERGAPQGELMEACGLSRGEAALILSLHAEAKFPSSGRIDSELDADRRMARVSVKERQNDDDSRSTHLSERQRSPRLVDSDRERQIDGDPRSTHLSERQRNPRLEDSDGDPYQYALRLAERGASEGELMDACGLSRGEAALILSMRAGVDHPSSEGAYEDWGADTHSPGTASPGRRPLRR